MNEGDLNGAEINGVTDEDVGPTPDANTGTKRRRRVAVYIKRGVTGRVS